MTDQPRDLPTTEVPVPRGQALPEGGVDSHFVNPAVPLSQGPPADGPAPPDGPV